MEDKLGGKIVNTNNVTHAFLTHRRVHLLLSYGAEEFE
jgi:hypothetical protein